MKHNFKWGRQNKKSRLAGLLDYDEMFAKDYLRVPIKS
jgi:hypothetical protein